MEQFAKKVKTKRSILNIWQSSECTFGVQETTKMLNFRGSHPEVFFRKGVLKICSKFTGEHSCRCVISVKLLKHGISNCVPEAMYSNTINYILTMWGQYSCKVGFVTAQVNMSIFLCNRITSKVNCRGIFRTLSDIYVELFSENIAVNYFRKTLHHRYLLGS